MDPWVPINKRAAVLLPNDRPFTELEALYSIGLDHNNGNSVTVLGIARRWGWSRRRVMGFLNRIGAQVVYPEPTAKRQKQTGQIMTQKTDRKDRKSGQNIFIDFNDLKTKADRNEGKSGQKADRKRHTTIEKEKENKKNTAFFENAVGGNGAFYRTKKGKKLTGWKLETFNEFWESFNWKKGKAEASDAWLSIPKLDGPLFGEILDAAKAEATRRPELIENGRSPKWAQGWLTGRRWEDEVGPEPQDPDDNVKWVE